MEVETVMKFLKMEGLFMSEWMNNRVSKTMTRPSHFPKSIMQVTVREIIMPSHKFSTLKN